MSSNHIFWSYLLTIQTNILHNAHCHEPRMSWKSNHLYFQCYDEYWIWNSVAELASRLQISYKTVHKKLISSSDWLGDKLRENWSLISAASTVITLPKWHNNFKERGEIWYRCHKILFVWNILQLTRVFVLLASPGARATCLMIIGLHYINNGQ